MTSTSRVKVEYKEVFSGKYNILEITVLKLPCIAALLENLIIRAR